MVLPIQSLMNMEMQLYGGIGMNANAPSYINNYQCASNLFMNPYMNPTFNGYNYNHNNLYNQNNTAFGQIIPQGYVEQAQAQNQAQPQASTNVSVPFEALNDDEIKALQKNYAESLSPSESIGSAAFGGATFGAIMAPRLIVHPIQSIRGTFDIKPMFSDIKKSGTWLNTTWLNKETNYVLRDAYAEMHKAASRSHWKIGLFRSKYKPEDYEKIKKIMQEALDSRDEKLIREATQKLKHINKANGLLPRAFNGIKGFLGLKTQELNITNRINEVHGSKTNTETVKLISEKASKVAAEKAGMTFKKALKRGGGIKGGLFFMGMELLFNFGKIKTAFSKDKKTGMKQLGQTVVKGAGSAIGWAAGEAVGVAGAAALGAKIGTLFGPGVGTIIGGLAGIVCGSIGCCLAGKVTNKLVGKDVADKIEAENLAKTEEGQLQLVQAAAEKIQSGKPIDPNAQNAVQKVLSLYA